MTMPSAEYMRAYRRRRSEERLHRMRELLGGRCVVCGATEALEFDHVVLGTKTFQPSMRCWDYSWRRLLAELAKCQLLCGPCHRAKTLRERGQVPARGTHGTVSAYESCGPPKCDECKAAKRAVHRAWRKRRRQGSDSAALAQG